MPDDSTVPHPALLNTWKHHAGWIRGRIADAVAAGPAGVAALPAEMVIVGTRLMDLYVGALTPAEIASEVFAHLRAHARFEPELLSQWLTAQGGYAVVELADASAWAVRLGPAGGRYIHLHPGRWSPHTRRVQANTLRSAVMAHALAGLTRGGPTDLRVVNTARERYLGLLPVRELSADSGLGAVIVALASG